MLVFAVVRSRRSGADQTGDPGNHRLLLGLIGAGLCGALLHVLMDLPTSYGTRLFSPFSETWFAFDWLPIIDIYVWIALASGLIAIARHADARMRIAGVVVALLIGHYSLRAVAHDFALKQVGEGRGRRLAVERWSGLPDPSKLAPCASPSSREMSGANRCSSAAIPRLLSPFQWIVIRQRAGGYALTEVDLLRSPAAGRTIWVPAGDKYWTNAALKARSSDVFMTFARLPRSLVHDDGREVTVQFQDLRFVRDLTSDPHTGNLGRNGLLSVVVRLDRHGTILADRLGD